MNNSRAAGCIRRRYECGQPKRDSQMNILRSVALMGISTLLLSGCANDLYASPYNSAPQQHAQVYQSQPRVIIVQPNRQSSGQSSSIYSQQGQVQQYNYYPGLNYQQPRQHQLPQQYQQPRYGQQPRYDRHNNYGQSRDRWSQQHQRPSQQQNNQYQRPDYRAQQQRYKEQRDYQREIQIRNRDSMLRNARPLPYQQSAPSNQHRNYGSDIRQQGSGRH